MNMSLDFLLEMMKNPVDFYTDEILEENNISVDHVIPFSYMYSDDIWNLVLTKKENNSSKSNHIPTQNIIDKLKERNKDLVNNMEDCKFKDDLILAIENNYVDKFYLSMKL